MQNYLRNPTQFMQNGFLNVEGTKTYYSTMAVTSPPHTYPPANVCIYCGDDKTKLTNEHIIPLSLGGTLQLPKSSCKKCAAITGRFEQRVTRFGLWPIRDRLRFPSRNKSARPKTFNIIATLDDGTAQQIPVDAARYPAIFLLQLFEKCRLLAGKPEPASAKVEKLTFFEFMSGPDDQYAKQIARPGIEKIEKETKRKVVSISPAAMPPFPFGQMIAKMAHAYACAEFGVGSFVPLLTDFIRDKDEILGKYIGGSFTRPPDSKTLLHKVQLEPILVGDQWYLVAKFHMFAIFCGGYYHAVVGKLTPPDEISDAWRQFYTRSTEVTVELTWTGDGPAWLRNGPQIQIGGHGIYVA